MSSSDFDRSGSAWISRGIESLFAGESGHSISFDVLIVGSGYGGAIAADTLTRCTKTNGDAIDVGVLERGKEYLPGAFPANSTELPGHVRFGRNKEGLFDLRASPDVGALVANGLGGGSLINAGVMKRPTDQVFDVRWPDGYRAAGSMNEFFERVELLLGARFLGAGSTIPNQIEKDAGGERLKKLNALHDLTGGQNFELAPVTVANSDKPNSGYVHLSDCIRCGDCATGCNHNAKDSLDTNLLVNAYRRGARIYSGATVLKVERNAADDGWLVHTAFTDMKLRAQHAPLVLEATNVILAAGTFGSTEILKRSEAAGLPISGMLGQKCSTNGDTMITHYDTGATVNAVGKEDVAPDKRQVGPTISGILDLREHPDPDLNGLLIEEMASPASMRRVFGELYATVNSLHRLGDCDRSWHQTGFPEDDVYELKEQQVDRSALYAVMGDDGANGEIEVTGSLTDDDNDGAARMRWPEVAYQPLFDKQVRAFRKLTEGKQGHVVPNPLWQLLPETVALLTQVERGPVVTVHPLGGCAMANRAEGGVVDAKGAVFDSVHGSGTHDGLAVLDGAIIPVSLGVNPALTIAAVALRAALALAKDWNYLPGPHAWAPESVTTMSPQQEAENEFFGNVAAPVPDVRPHLRPAETDQAFEPAETMVRLTERMSGTVRLRGGSDWLCRKWVVELTLRFDEKSLRALTRPSSHDSTLAVQIGGDDPVTRSQVRVFEKNAFEEATKRNLTARELEERLDEVAAFKTSVESGTLKIFQRQRSWFVWRIVRAAFAWLANHGLRDIWQAIFSGDGASAGGSIRSWVRSLLALTTRAGEVRKFKYELTLRDPVPAHIGRTGSGLGARLLRGEKCFTYGPCSNPWNQLMQMRLTRFPGLVPWWRRDRLDLDLPYLARIRIPLLEITRQNDGVTALAELASFLTYFLRMLLGIHGLSFRAPDEPREARTPRRLPGKLRGIPQQPEIHTLSLGKERPYHSELPEGDPDAEVSVYVRLARYARYGSGKPPIVMMHGYSASGTTFAHNAVKNNFVRHFHDQGRDVWVADFRTSCGMPTAAEPWSFEQVAYRDIPEIVDYVCAHTDFLDTDGKPKIDVIAHCMGAAMLSMGILHAGELPYDSFLNPGAGEKLPKRLRRLVFTQIGPLPVMAPMNIFRGYVTSFFRELLPDRYQFNPGPHDDLADRLFDRLLATVPYPKKEFRIENPLLPWRRTPWTRTRHRMDILYGRVFNGENMDRKVLRHIDDFFGPLSIDTVTQTINFARYSVITNVDGRNTFVSRENLEHQWQKVPLLQVNAGENGLVDHRTVYRMKDVFDDAGRSFQYKIIDDAGHQDCLIGKRPRRKTLEAITEYLDHDSGALQSIRLPNESFVAYTPWIGPVRTIEPSGSGKESFRVGSHPTHRYTEGVLLLRVLLDDGRVLRPNGQPFADTPQDRDYLVQHAYFITNQDLRQRCWGKFLLPPDVEGNAWLALLAYADSEVLNETTAGYYRSTMIAQEDGPAVAYMGQLKPGGKRWEFPEDSLYHICPASGERTRRTDEDLIRNGVLFDRQYFRRMIDPAVTLLSQQMAVATKAGSTALHAGDLRARDEAVPVAPMGATLVTPAGADAALDRLTDERYDLRDGLMPDVEAAPANECAFLLSSCQYPAGFMDGPLAYESYRETLRRLASGTDPGDGAAGIVPRFGVFTGDQIYADASAGLFDPSVKRGRFELPYHMWLRFPHVRGVLRRIRSFMLLDDHEVNDNWEPIPGDIENEKLMTQGDAGYMRFQRGINESFPYSYDIDGCTFAMLNTRGERTARSATTAATADILDSTTITGIDNLLAARPASAAPLFLVSPSMLLPRHRRAAQWNSIPSSLRSDGWDGYPHALFHLLQSLVANESKNVVFLSGDEHMPCWARVEIEDTSSGAKAVAYSIHTAAAYAPFPFANGSRAAQLDQETIFFNVDQTGVDYRSDAVTSAAINPADYRYRCEIETNYPPATDGMTNIRIWKNSGRWSLRAEFGDHPADIADLTI